jgi:DNA-binding CsgD family transcriptional regulator
MATAGALVLGGPIPSLTRWGCSPDGDLVYRELLHGGSQSASTLGRELGLPVRRIRDALQELLEFDAAVAYRPDGSARADHWRPRPAREVVAALSQRQVRPLGLPAPVRAQLHLVSSLLGNATELDSAVRVLPTVEATRRRLAELASIQQIERLAMKPASVKPAYRAVDEPINPRWRYREARTVSLKLFVIDRKVALFPVDPLNRDRGYLEVVRTSVAEALAGLFDRHWAQARDPRENEMPELNLTARERSLIHLLAKGHTDATAARELQISPRSVSNILRALMDQLGVENRFQLGLALGALRLAETPGAGDRLANEEN